MFPAGRQLANKTQEVDIAAGRPLFMAFSKIHFGQADFCCDALAQRKRSECKRTTGFSSHWAVLSLFR
jgi:hypothetical protein